MLEPIPTSAFVRIREKRLELATANTEYNDAIARLARKVTHAQAQLRSEIAAAFEVSPWDIDLSYDWPCAESPTEECIFADTLRYGCVICGDPKERK